MKTFRSKFTAIIFTAVFLIPAVTSCENSKKKFNLPVADVVIQKSDGSSLTVKAELAIKEDTTVLADGLYTYGCTLPGTAVNTTLNDKIDEGTDDTMQDSVILIKFDNGKFPRVIVARNVSDAYFGAYPNPISGPEGTFANDAIDIITGNRNI